MKPASQHQQERADVRPVHRAVGIPQRDDPLVRLPRRDRRPTHNSITSLHRVCGFIAAMMLGHCNSIAATVVGSLQDVLGVAPTTTTIRFTPQSTPILDGGVLITSTAKSIVATNGVFSTILAAGDYEVTVGGKDSFQISVPSSSDTLNWQDLVTDELTYIYAGVPRSYAAPIATSTIAGLVRTHNSAPDPVVYLDSEVDELIARMVTAGSFTNLASPNPITFPDGTGSPGNVLATDGAGTLSWADAVSVVVGKLPNSIVTLGTNATGGGLRGESQGGGPYFIGAFGQGGEWGILDAAGNTVTNTVEDPAILLNRASADALYVRQTNGYVLLQSVSALPTPVLGQALIVPRTNSSGGGLVYLPSPGNPTVLAPGITTNDVAGTNVTIYTPSPATPTPVLGEAPIYAATNSSGRARLTSTSNRGISSFIPTEDDVTTLVTTVDDLYTAATNTPVLVRDSSRGGLFYYVPTAWQTVLAQLRDVQSGVTIASGGSGYALKPMSVFPVQSGTGYTSGVATVSFPYASGGGSLRVHVEAYPVTNGSVFHVLITNSATTYYTNSAILTGIPIVQGANTNATAVIGAYVPLERAVAGGTKTTAANIQIYAVTNGVATSVRIDNNGAGVGYTTFPGTFSAPYYLTGIASTPSGGETAVTFTASLPVGYYYPSANGGYWSRYTSANDPINMRYLVGDTNDIQLQLQTAVDMCQEQGRDLYFPEGDYRLATVFVRAGVTNLTWRGTANSRLRIASQPHLTDVPNPGTTGGRPRYTTYSAERAIYFTSPSNVVIRNLVFTGPGTDAQNCTNGPAYAVSASWGVGVIANDFLFDGCRFDHIRHQAVSMDSSVDTGTGQKVRNCTFYQCLKDPFQSGSALIGDISGAFEVSGNTFEHCGNWGPFPSESHYHLLYGEAANNARIIDNTFISSNEEDALDVVAGYMGISTNILVKGNTVLGYIKNTKRDWIYGLVQNLTIEGNVVVNARVIVGTGSAVVTGNSFRMAYRGYPMDIGGWPLDGEAGAPGTLQLYLANNKFELYCDDATLLTGGLMSNVVNSGMNFVRLTNSVIENNIFDHVPIRIAESWNTKVRNNTSFMNRWAKLNASGAMHVYYIQTSQDMEFTGNRTDVRDRNIWSLATYNNTGSFLARDNDVGIGLVQFPAPGTYPKRGEWQNVSPAKILFTDRENLMDAEKRNGQHYTVSGGDAAAYISTVNFTNAAGGSLILNSGRGTGTGTNAIVLRTAPVLASGATIQTNQDRMMIDAAGRVWIHSGDVQLGGGTRLLSGSGTTSETGYVGSVYMNSGGGPVTALYVKTGSAPTSWMPVLLSARALQEITAANQSIDSGALQVQLSCDATYTMTGVSQVTAGAQQGQLLFIKSTEASDRVTLQDESVIPGSMLQLGAPSRTIGPTNVLQLMWTAKGTTSIWQEVSYR